MQTLLVSLAVLLNFNLIAASTSSTIYIIRHGEKKWALGCLNSNGKKRASLLPNIFNNSQPFLTPTNIFANYYDDGIDCERCIETVTPIAKDLNLAVNSSLGYNKKLGGNKLAAQVMRRKILASPLPLVLLVAWEHFNIQFLTEALGVQSNKIPSWSGSDYDTVYILEFNATAHLTSFVISAENIKP